MKEYPALTNTSKEYSEIKKQFNGVLRNLGRPHIESFNYMIEEGLQDCIRHMNHVKFCMSNGNLVELFMKDINISSPSAPIDSLTIKNKKVFPAECRQRSSTYEGMANVTIGWTVNGVEKGEINKDLGEVPIMLKSSLCHLSNLSPKELIEKGEHQNEWGGQFISKGKEKLIRMLIMQRRNFPIACKRSSWKDRGTNFSDIGIMIRCVQTDQTSKMNVLHLLTNGSAKLMFSDGKVLFFVPVILIMKCLVNHTDEYIYKQLIKGYESDQYYNSCIQNMIRDIHDEGVHNHHQCKEYMGSVFSARNGGKYNWATNIETTDLLLHAGVLIHLNNNNDKFNLLVLMVQKLFQAAQDKIKLEGSDTVMMQELLLGGHLYQSVLKEKLEALLFYVKTHILKKQDTELSEAHIIDAIRKAGTLKKVLGSFIGTGNLNTRTGLGLMQTTGLSINVENINRMRYMSHFKSVHRGSFFVEMRTTEARQLLPEAWGFICPVHTPDGSPCGLLNHLTVNCVVSPNPKSQLVENIPQILIELGMIPLNSILSDNITDKYIVTLEGRILGYIKQSEAASIVAKMRLLKIAGKKIPKMMEIVLIPLKKKGQFPGLYLFVGAARMMRPVLNLEAGKLELIGTFEQVYMDICITLDEAYKGLTTHMEPSKTAFLSNLANLIPMPDCNQSPRNMYQCQMAKQTMGTPCHNWQFQAENKLYRLQTPGTPLFRPVHHDNIDLDDFPMGTNAIVAVISYTGYDMEDAMIINKAAEDRGLAHGSIYKSEFVELSDDSYFCRDPHRPELIMSLDSDGLPHPGTRLSKGCLWYCYYDTNAGKFVTSKFRGSEVCIVDNIKLCGDFNTSANKVACITFRIQRNPSVGDKFASRAGQKGICSQKWPAEDLPFTESGLIPDIVFNPHGFPSRMTIAMMIEIMAGKSAALHGLVHDATPFRFTEKDTAIEYFGKLLEAGGYNHYGTERMYSGIDGREMKADIFFGIVHYQRLRHMVSDKWQVRSTGPIDSITHQPIKGRKRGGGVRFGEMERDSLISHGSSFLLQDRLFHCSDKITTMICKKCGTMVGPIDYSSKTDTKNAQTCRLCNDDKQIDYVEIPYIFKFLVAQLSSVNINLKLNFKSV